MSILRTIKCNIEGCKEHYTEKSPAEGWPKWGAIEGKQNDNGETTFHLCPTHLMTVFDFINRMIKTNKEVDGGLD